jgi:hypothetical protein
MPHVRQQDRVLILALYFDAKVQLVQREANAQRFSTAHAVQPSCHNRENVVHMRQW